MFECRLASAEVLKQILEAMKDLVQDANLDCSANGITLQAMDQSHVSLVALKLGKDAFDHFRCDRASSLGLSLVSLAKVLKCSVKGDSVTLRAEDDGDSLTIIFESESGGRISEFSLKLMDIDSDHLGIPDTDYKAVVALPSSEFQRLVRDLSVIGDTVSISCAKDQVKWDVSGDLGDGSVVLRPGSTADSEDAGVMLEMEEPVSLSFALRYLNYFSKATPLAPSVSLSLSPDVPLVVEYRPFSSSYLRFYLAPKIEDEEGET